MVWHAQTYISAIRERMPELPDATRARLLAQGLSQRDVEVLMDVDSGREVGFDGELGRGAVAYFDEVSRGRDPKAVVNWYETISVMLQLARVTSWNLQDHTRAARPIGFPG